MKRHLLATLLLLGMATIAHAEVDPNFYIYLCFGQSNMEGNAQPEAVDKQNVDKRFQMLATTNFDTPKRTQGQWYTATPPIVSPQGGLGMADYFGRTMVAALPDSIKVGVVDVAIGGCAIQMFDKDKYKTQMTDPSNWSTMLANKFYAGNPYKRLVDMAKKAQESGVIKGILLHQGCSNNMDPNWPTMVKKIYDDLLKDLGLGADSVPLFAGETLRQEFGGACYGHNTVIAKLSTVLPNSYVISSEGCEGNGQDPWHFCAMGYRIMGKRYAFAALGLMGRELKADAGYQFPATYKKFYTAKSIDLASDIHAVPGQRFNVTATFMDGHTEDVSAQMEYRSDDVVFTGTALANNAEGEGQVEAVYTDFALQEIKQNVHVDVHFFPFHPDCFTKMKGTLTLDEAARTVKLTAGGQAGWIYNTSADMSAYKYLVVKLKEPQTCNAQVRIYAQNDLTTGYYSSTIGSETLVAIDLANLRYSNRRINPGHISIVSFYCPSAGTLLIDDVYLTSNEDFSPNGIVTVEADGGSNAARYTLQGIRTAASRPGLYIQNGKKVLTR